MNIIDIDKGFVDIIDFLNSHEYKPVSSCDGTVENHEDKIERYAYITFLESEKVYELMAGLLQTSIFEVGISNLYHVKPYKMYGNVISGNLYGVYFYNMDGSRTQTFEDLIKKIDSGEIRSSKDYLNIIRRTANVVRDEADSDNMLRTEIKFNHKLLGHFNEGIMVDISTKEGASVEVDLSSISEEVYRMLKEEGIDIEYYSESNLAINPNLERGIVSLENEIFQMYFKNEDFDKVIEIINFIKTVQYKYFYCHKEDNLDE